MFRKLLLKKLPLVLLLAMIAFFVDSATPGVAYWYRFTPRVKGIIDTHEHYTVGGNMQEFLQLSEELGIRKTVFLPTGMAPDNDGYKENMRALLEMQKQYPDQIIAFCTVNAGDQKAPEIFEDCLNNGGKGLKLIDGHPEFYNAPLNSPNMKRLFEIADRRKVPVLMHVSMYRLPKAGNEFKELLDQFPTVRVQVAHYCCAIYEGVHLEICSELLDRYPNVYVDLSMGVGLKRAFQYMRKDLKPIKDFILKYQDRITYGSDIILSSEGLSSSGKWLRDRMSCDLSALQDDQVYCPVILSNTEMPVPGFSLPQEVLQKILVRNPSNMLK